jgi:hypothetical protein
VSNKLRTIEELWQEFAVAVIPPAASPAQHREMRRAFYAGAHGMLGAALEAVGDNDVPEEVGMQWFKDRHDEGVAFGQAIVDGKA